MESTPCIMFVFAHPDDESFMVAGAACRYAEQGVRLALVVATRGGTGKCGNPPICTPKELPDEREQELRAAAKLLGIADTHVFDYEDGKLAEAEPDELRARLVRLMREHRPQIVITFDPHDGEKHHPDHIAISRFTSDAVALAADGRFMPEAGARHQTERLLWTTPQAFWGLARLDQPEVEPGVDFLLDGSRWWKRKAEALRTHRSQNISINKIFFDQPDTERILSTEFFRQGWGAPLSKRPQDDLFAELEQPASD